MTWLMNLFRRYSPTERLLATVRLLGVTQALKVLGMTAFSAGASVTRVRLPGVPSDFWMRTGTSDLVVALQIFLRRDYDLSWCKPYKLHVEQLCNMIVEDGNIPLIVDAGANIGASTLWLVQNFQNCRILAIEPERENFELLSRNVGHCPNVTLFNAALWNMPTELSLTEKGITGWAVRVQQSDGRGSVRGVTIPELLASDKRLRPVIVKIDIEGAETTLLRDHTEWIDDIPLVIFEQHDNLWHWLGTWQGSGHAFFSVLSRRKREYLIRGENVFAFLHPTMSRERE